MIKLKEVFETANENGEKIKLVVKRPAAKELDGADCVYNQTFMHAHKKHAPLQSKISQIIEEEGLWGDVQKKEMSDLDKEIKEAELKLAKGAGAGTKLELRKVAIKLRELRYKRDLLTRQFSSLEAMTCEVQANNRKFDYLVSACTLYENGDLYFSTLEDYLERRNEKAAFDAASTLMSLIYGISTDYQKDLPENKFLLKYGFCNDKLHLIDKNGAACDENFNLVDEETGLFLDKDGNLVNNEGHLLNKDGTLKVEFMEFPEDVILGGSE